MIRLFLVLLFLASCQYDSKEKPLEYANSPQKPWPKMDTLRSSNPNTSEYERHLDAIMVVKGMNPKIVTDVYFLNPYIKDIERYEGYTVGEQAPDSLKKVNKRLHSEIKKKKPLVYAHGRKLVAKELKNKLWEHDVEVRLSDRTITFESYRYSLNANIKADYEAFFETAQLYGFKKIVFSDGYESYTYTLN